MAPFGLRHFREAVHALTELALQTDKGVLLVGNVLDMLRRNHVIAPALEGIERFCVKAVTRANRRTYRALTEPLFSAHLKCLDTLRKCQGR